MATLLFTNSVLKGLRIIKVGPNFIQAATITGRLTRGEPACLPKPFPYEDKKISWFTRFSSSTIRNVSQENARIIVVEGPIGVGKSAFCSLLAEQFDMLFIPQPTMDLFYCLPSGYDLRQHNDELPEELRTYDHKNFCIEPKTWKAGLFQYYMMNLRFYQYIDALCHLLNTGQGIVLERSYFSDYVFMQAMREQKFISKNMGDVYSEIYRNTSTFLIPPHLVIYLDIPVPVVQERIRTRNFSWEQNSPALTTEYLTSLEKFWKQDYLKRASETSEILIYDWSDGGSIEVVIDDIEKLDFDIMRSDKKFAKWRLNRNLLFGLRYSTTNEQHKYDLYFYYPWYKVDEVEISSESVRKWNEMLCKIPECLYDIGYNPKIGDSFWKILFSTRKHCHRKFRYYLAWLRRTYIDSFQFYLFIIFPPLYPALLPERKQQKN